MTTILASRRASSATSEFNASTAFGTAAVAIAKEDCEVRRDLFNTGFAQKTLAGLEARMVDLCANDAISYTEDAKRVFRLLISRVAEFILVNPLVPPPFLFGTPMGELSLEWHSKPMKCDFTASVHLSANGHSFDLFLAQESADAVKVLVSDRRRAVPSDLDPFLVNIRNRFAHSRG